MNRDKIKSYGDTLYDCLRNRTTIEPITDKEKNITIEDAYYISRHLLRRRISVISPTGWFMVTVTKFPSAPG